MNFLLYPMYVRGEAFLTAHQGTAAATEFQKILDHPGLVLNEPIGAPAHLELGRAYALSGDMNKAKTAYQGFLAGKTPTQTSPSLAQGGVREAEIVCEISLLERSCSNNG